MAIDLFHSLFPPYINISGRRESERNTERERERERERGRESREKRAQNKIPLVVFHGSLMKILGTENLEFTNGVKEREGEREKQKERKRE